MSKWTKEQKEAASKRMTEMHEAKKSADAKARVRTPLGAKRDILSVQNPEEGYVYRIVNDTPGRINRFKEAGYELVEDAQLGTSHVDGNQASQGIVSKDVGKGVTAVVMRQRDEFYKEDQAEKQRKIDELENSMRKKKVNPNESTDGTYGEVKIG